jgi:predicted phage baseplate assembly protein
MSTDPRNACGCCETPGLPTPVHNDPGLPALRYRVDTQPGFLARMLQTLPLAQPPGAAPTADAARPLARLLTREPDDPTVALLDAAACVADVLSFYQERIANEGFLRTATERRSVLELARAIGYELKPGVAASVHLAFSVEDAPGAPGVCTLAAGSAVQGVPPQGQLPQVFETTDTLVARAEWNALKPRQRRPADMAVLERPGEDDGAVTPVLVLLGPAGSFPAGTEGLHAGLAAASLHRLDPDLPVEPTVDALEVGRLYVAATVTGLRAGDLLLFVGRQAASRMTLVLRITAVEDEPALARQRVDVEPLPAPVADPPAPRPATWFVPYRVAPIASYAQAQVQTVSFTQSSIAATVTGQAWRESELQAMIGLQGWNPQQLLQAIAATPPPAVPSAPEAGAFAFGARLGFFGHNAPRWQTLPSATASTHGDAYPEGWDDGDTGVPAGTTRTVWQTSQGQAIAPLAYVERAVEGVVRGSWVVVDAPDLAARAYSVLDARETSRADYGISGRAMRLRLADADGVAVSGAEPFGFRSAGAHVASRRLPLAELPIAAPVAAGSTAIELDRMVLGLVPGQRLALVGEDATLAGVTAAEIAVVAEVVHADGRSSVMLRGGLVHAYRRESLTINANVAHATHGETVDELLGNGDASLPHQRFVLRRPPLTHVSATGGAASTLELRVAGVAWEGVPTLHGRGAGETVYTTRIADDGTTTLAFGDGRHGARLPSGTLNVAAHYRSGIGAAGEVGAGTLTMLRARPLGLREVSNPVAAAGAEDPERLADARRNAPLTMLTFDRVVSQLDYADYARAFPGVGKARGDLLWVDGGSRIALTITGATGGAPGPDVADHLVASIAAASDPAQRFHVAAFALRYFALAARVAVDERFVADDVRAAVAAAVVERFGFDARELGQSVTAADLFACMHEVAGVVAVDIDELRPVGGDHPAGTRLDAVPAFGAHWDPATRSVVPAELLVVNPAALVIGEFAA